MIPLLIIWMVRKYRILGSRKAFSLWLVTRLRYYTFRVITIATILVLFSISLKAQNKEATYRIFLNGKLAGQLKFQQRSKGDSVCLVIESQVKTSILFPITILSREEAIYEKGILLYSSIYRKNNGNEKTNQQMRLRGNEYQITNREKKEVFRNYPIRYNMLSLYCCEPRQIYTAYSDKFQQYMPVEKVAEGKYKVSLPDDNYNYYYYKEGICVAVDIHASLYSAVILLNE
jgi:hypothetical protein